MLNPQEATGKQLMLSQYFSLTALARFGAGVLHLLTPLKKDCPPSSPMEVTEFL